MSKFHQIPACLSLSPHCTELNVSFLQVIAILSFEKENHKAIKDIDIIKQLLEHKRIPKGGRLSEEINLFDEIFDHFEMQTDDFGDQSQFKPTIKMLVAMKNNPK